MTTLYKPVLIESAEQAEALPDGAILHRPDRARVAHPPSHPVGRTR